MLALFEAGVLAWLVTGSDFTIRQVQVEGLKRVDRGQLVAAAGLDKPTSIFTVQSDQVRRRVDRLAWVRDVRARVEFPDRVVLQVTEWQPVAVFHAGPGGARALLNDDGVVMAGAAPGDRLVDIQGPATRGRKVGEKALDPALLSALVGIQRDFPQVVPGESVKAYELDACGNLVLDTTRGWKVYFGRVLTADELAALQDKVTALHSLALAAKPEVGAPDLEYVNVMNPSLPALHRRSDRPPPSPAPANQPPSAKPSGPVAVPVPSIQVQPCQ